MAGEVIITTGYTFTDDNEPVTVAKLNQLGTPTARVAPGSIGAEEIDAASVAGALENVAATRNHFRDPLFTNPWQTTAGQTHASGATVFNHPEWYAYGATGNVTVSRETVTPTDQHGNRFALKVTGDATATGIGYIGQLIPAAVAGALDEEIAISFWFKNGSGDDLTPSIRLLGCSSLDDFATLAELDSDTLSEVANGQWKLLTYTFDTSALTNWRNGGAIEIVIPTGALDAGGKSVSFCMPQMERGSVTTSFIVPETAVRPTVKTTTTDPTVNNDWTEGYRPGDLWRNTTDSGTFLCAAHQPAGAAVWVELINSTTLAAPAYIHLQDRKAQNTQGMSLTSGSWVKRDLTNELLDTGNHCSLATSQFTLSAGTYDIFAEAEFFKCGNFQTRLYNATAAAVVADVNANDVYGDVAVAAAVSDTGSRGLLRARFTVAASQALEFQCRVGTTNTTNGGGIRANLGPEIYAQVWLVKVA